MASQPPAGQPAGADPERRLYSRQPLYLDALLTGRWSRSFGGKIRDYCPSGIFFAWEEPHGGFLRAEDNPIARDDPVAVKFAFGSGDAKRKFELSAKVARVLEAGVGLAFDDPDPAAVQALQREANRNLRQAAPLPGQTTLGPGADERQIISRCKEVAAIRLSAMIGAFFDQADEALFIAARRATTSLEQTQYFDASSELKKGSVAIAPEVLGTILDRLDEMGKPNSAPQPQLKDLEPTELSLVETDALEDLLMVADIVTKAEPLFENEIYELEQRFSHLVGAPIDKSSNPVGVHTICQSFAEGLDRVKLGPQQRRIVFGTLNDAVVPALGSLYEELNALLKASDVLPDLRRGVYSQMRRPAPSKPRPTPRGPSSATGFPDAAEEPAAAVAAPPATAADTLGTQASAPPRGFYRTARTLLGLQRQLGVLPGGGGRAGSADANPPLPLSAPQGPGLKVQESVPGAKEERLFALDDVVDALSALQRETTQPWSDQVEAPDLRSRLQDVLTRRSAGGAERRLSEELGSAIDMMSNLFESIAADGTLPDKLKGLYRRLEIPLQKMAVLDPQFFDAPSHPARQLLNQLADLQPPQDLDATWDPELQQRLERVVDRVAEGFERDPAVFSEALGELERIAEANATLYQNNVRELVRELESQQRFLKSRRRGASDEAPGGARRQQALPKEWEVWLNRAKRLQAGDSMSLKQGGGHPTRVRIAWIGENFNPYVFVNAKGEKAATMTLQELAMQLRRGTALILDPSELPVVDRSLYTSLLRLHDQIGQRALHDPATGLLNRKHFRGQLAQALAQARESAATHVLIQVEIDGIKLIIDKFGRSAGEALLRKIGGLLNKPVGSDAVLGRVGAQDFGVLLEHYTLDEARTAAEEQLGLIAKLRVKWKEQTYSLTPSAGLVLIDAASEGTDGLLSAAADACLQAREAGEIRLQVAAGVEAPATEVSAAPDWQAWLEGVAGGGELILYCQQLLPLGADQAVKPQVQFFPGIPQESGEDFLTPPPGLLESPEAGDKGRAFDLAVLRRVLAWMADQRPRLKDLACCVISLCGNSLADEKLAETVLEQLAESGVPPGKVCFQIHEKAAVSRLGEAERFIRTLKEFGCRFALDGLGSGTTASGYLNSLPVDFLKIDGIFVRDLGESDSDAAVVSSLNEIAHLMGKKTIAQEVSDDSALERLRTMGVDYGQGLCITHAVALDDLK